MTAYNTAVLADTPNLYYSLDEASTPAQDISGAGGPNLNKGANATMGVAGTSSTNAVAFVSSGTTSTMTSAAATSVYNIAQGIDFWIKTTSTSKQIMSWTATGVFRTITIDASGFVVDSFKGRSVDTAVTNTSTTAINDGNWHHVYLFMDRFTYSHKIYIDGISAGTTSGTIAVNSTTGTLVLGSTTSGGSFAGTLDEFATYPGALTGTRISAHKNAATFAASVDVTVTTPTMSLTSIEGTYLTPFSSDYTTTTAGPISLTANDVTVEAKKIINVLQQTSNDGRWDVSSHIYDQDSATTVVTSGTAALAMKFAYPVGGVETMLTAKIHLARNLNSGDDAISYRLWTITSPWTASGSPDLTLSTGFIDATAAQLDFLDINSLIDPANFYGVVVQKTGSGSSTWRTREFGDTSTPAIEFIYEYAPQGATVDVLTGAVSLDANAVTVRADSILDQPSGAITLNGVDATVETSDSPNTIIDVPTPTLSANSVDATVTINTTVDLTTPNISLVAYETTTAVSTNAYIEAEVGRLSIVGIRPSEVNGEPVGESEDDDVFYNQTLARKPLIWYRGKVTEIIDGVPYVANRGTGSPAYFGRLNGVTVGTKNGIESRATMGFDGADFIRELEPNPDELTYGARTLEFTVRTNKANEFLFGGIDNYGLGTTIAGNTRYVDFYLNNGRIEQRRDNSVLFTGFKNIADGAWHHVAIVSKSDDVTTPGGRGYIEVWIDGQLDIRRRSGQGQPEYTTWGFPDYIGGRSGEGTENGVSRDVPSGNWFIGDLTEIVYYDYLLSEDDILAQRDAAFAVVPVRVETGILTLTSKEAVAKGNKTRMLWIDLRAGTGFSQFPQDNNLTAWRQTQDATTQFSKLVIENGSFQHFRVNGVNWLDAKLDEPRLIDINVDINLDDFDAIGFIGYPVTSDEKAQFRVLADPDNNGKYGQTRIDQFIASLKTALVGGKNLMVTNPLLAVDLGIINDYDNVPSLWEINGPAGSAVPYSDWNSAGYDGYAATINPFQTDPSLGPWAAQYNREPKIALNTSRLVAGNYYYDQHRNDRFRVRNLVPGLTDIGSFIQVDQMVYLEPVPYGDRYFAKKFRNRMVGGLSIGDEFYLADTVQYVDPASVAGGYDKQGTIATAPGGVKLGTIVTTFGSTIGMGVSLTTNPYRDYVTTIAVEPGTQLPDGRIITGKVFVDFTEDPAYNFGGYTMDKQVIPTNAEQLATLPENRRHLENDEQRDWDWATYRGDSSAYTVSGKAKYQLNADGSITQTASGEEISLTAYKGWWSNVSVPFETMMSRGFLWLSKSNELQGNVQAGVESAKMTLTAVEATVETQFNSTVDVTTARMTLESFTDANTVSPNSTVIVGTPTITMVASPFQEIVDVETGRITLQSYEDLGTVVDPSEVISLTLLGTPGTITLLLKEES